jgi:predicted outer membrane repeat protein
MIKDQLIQLFVLLNLSLTTAIGQTIVPGGTASGSWTATGSPYIVNGAIMVANGTTLTIDPGVRVIFQGSYKFLVLGRVLAVGNASDSITFTAADTSIGWLGVRFENTSSTNDTSRFSYCKFERGVGVSPYSGGCGMTISNFSKVIVSNSLFAFNKGIVGSGALTLINYAGKIINSRFYKNKSDGNGGAMQISGGSPLIKNCTFDYNSAKGQYEGGGAIYCISTAPVITNCKFFVNTALVSGGAIYGYTATGSIANNSFSGNAAEKGGAIYVYTSSCPQISFNRIYNNRAVDGGGIFCEQCLIDNSVITNNTATGNGGGVYSYSMNSSKITNATIANNLALYGGGIYFNYSSPVIKNSILWGNAASVSGTQVYLTDEPSDPEFRYCDIQGGSNAFGTNSNVFFIGQYVNNIDSLPKFIQPSAGAGSSYGGSTVNWNLNSISPCINAGDPNGPYSALDLAGSPRVSDGVIDIGAYEALSTGVDQTNKKRNASVYPNPLTDHGIISINDNSSSFSLTIINTNGIVVKTIFTSSKIIELDRADLDSGLYFLKISSESALIAVKKLIIE